MSRTPGRQLEGQVQRRPAAAAAHDETAHVVACGVGLVELASRHGAAPRPVPAVDGIVEEPAREALYMHHQVLADEPARVGQPIRMSSRCRHEEQARRAQAAARDHRHRGMRLLDGTVDVVIPGPASAAVWTEDDLAHAGVRPQLDPVCEGARPVRQIGCGQRSLWAPERAPAEVDTGRAASIVLGGDGLLGRPPVPAELLVSVYQQLPGAADRRRRIWKRISRGATRVAGEACHADLGLVDRVVRGELLVVERPVDRHSIQRAHAKIGRRHAPVVAGEAHLAAADRVVQVHVDRVLTFTAHRIVGRPSPHVGVGRPMTPSPHLPVDMRFGQARAIDPVALLQADDLCAFLRQALAQRCPGRPGADDEDVRIGVAAHLLAPLSVSTMRYRGGIVRTRPSSDASNGGISPPVIGPMPRHPFSVSIAASTSGWP